MSIDDKVIYVFARQDLPVAKQLVHCSHAVFEMANQQVYEPGIPSVVVIGTPDEKALHRVVKKLQDNSFSYLAWVDPNYPELGLAAVCTVPLSQEQRPAMACYRIYKPV